MPSTIFRMKKRSLFRPIYSVFHYKIFAIKFKFSCLPLKTQAKKIIPSAEGTARLRGETHIPPRIELITSAEGQHNKYHHEIIRFEKERKL